MKCSSEVVELMHKHLDEELSQQEETALRSHLQVCEDCQKHFHELKRTIAMVQTVKQVHPPEGLVNNVMNSLPKEKKRIGYRRWLKAHPMLTAVAIFFVLMFGSVMSIWNQDHQLSVSKQENIIIQNNTVIVPEGKTIDGDLVVKNGNLRIEGSVNGDVLLINGENYLASAGEITGDIEKVDQVFDWIWYYIKKTTIDIFSLGDAK